MRGLAFVAFTLTATLVGCPSPEPPRPPLTTAATATATATTEPTPSASATTVSDVADASPSPDAAIVVPIVAAPTFDTALAALDLGPKAQKAPIALKNTAVACGITFTLTVESHKQYADPTEGSVGIWEFTLAKNGKVVELRQTAKTLYLEGSAFGCLYVLEGDYATEHIVAVPGAPKPFTEDEALAFAKAEASKRGLPMGSASSTENEGGVLDVVLSAASGGGHTRMRIGLYTRRVISIEVKGAKTAKPNPPPKYADPCKVDAECEMGTSMGCCDCCGYDAPYAISKSHAAKERAPCAAVDCAPCNEAKCPQKPPLPKTNYVAICTKGICALK